MTNEPYSIIELIDRIQNLEDNVRKMQSVEQFNLKSIHQKYKKAFPLDGEEPFFKCKNKYTPQYPKVFRLDSSFDQGMSTEILLPTKKKEYRLASERMKKYLEQVGSNEKHCKESKEDTYKLDHLIGILEEIRENNGGQLNIPKALFCLAERIKDLNENIKSMQDS
jgi:hypothetical protein